MLSLKIMLASSIFIFLLSSDLALGQIIFSENESPRENYQDRYVNDGLESFSLGEGSNLNVNSIPIDSRYKENRIANGLNRFGLRLNSVLMKNSPEGSNVVMSPLSIAGALTLLLLGSVGQTFDELAAALGFFNDHAGSRSVHTEFGSLLDKITSKRDFASIYREPTPNVTYGSAIFLQNDCPVREQYSDFVRTIYKTLIAHVDFRSNGVEATGVVNGWVSHLTNGKIPNMLQSPPTAQTRLIIASALYFQSEWEKLFLVEATKREPFILDKRYPSQTVSVDMMFNEGFFPYHLSREHECVLLGLPYKGNNTFLYAIKPLDATRKNLKQIMSEMSPEILDSLIRNARTQSTIVAFPKMKLSSSYNLKSALQDLGVQSVFSSAHSNLALLSPNERNQMSMPPPVSEKYTEQIEEEDEEKFIFSRFGEENRNEHNCSEVFQSRSVKSANCTANEMIDGKQVQVVYKRLGDKIGRRILSKGVKRDVEYVTRFRRQTNMDMWNPGLYVDEVVHKVDMDITETGTEGAAATIALIKKGGIRPVFRADEPFFFMIRDEETKFILFSGTVYKPVPSYT